MVSRTGLATALLAGSAGWGALAQTATGPAISVDVAANQHAISQYIYGMAEYGVQPSFQSAAHLSVLRWGGDGTTRYNWQVDSSNAGFDWYFMGGSGETNPVPGAGADALVAQDKAAGSQTLLTIPIIPYINSSAAWNCSFPVSVYGAQQSTNPYVHPNGDNCGNSISASGAQLQDTNISSNNVANTPTLQGQWIQHLVQKWGTASAGGVQFYQLDNEPGGWGNTHRDVEPGGASYSAIVTLGQQYAAAIKQVDPSAVVLGPSDFTLGGWIGTTNQQDNLFAGQYYLQQMASYNQTTGTRLLDYFDEHYYFSFSDPTSQLASTRTLWDPTYNGGTWVEQYFFNGPMQLIPRFKQWINQYYPGTKLALSEYSIDSGKKQISDALAEADVLGIFGAYGVDFAALWGSPQPTDPIAFSFLLYRNYDGNNSMFGSKGVSATSADQGTVSAYAAQRDDGTLTAVLINKTGDALTVPVSVSNPAPTASARMFSYSGADLTSIHALSPVAFSAGSAQVALPAWSMNLIEVPLSTNGDTASGNTYGSGPDTLVVHLAEAQYLGDAQGQITLDGQVLPGSPMTVTAIHGQGQSQTFTVHGTFGSGAHQLGVTFTNDAYAGSASLDRNLYVLGATFNGQAPASESVQNCVNAPIASGTAGLYCNGDTALLSFAASSGN